MLICGLKSKTNWIEEWHGKVCPHHASEILVRRGLENHADLGRAARVNKKDRKRHVGEVLKILESQGPSCICVPPYAFSGKFNLAESMK